MDRNAKAKLEYLRRLQGPQFPPAGDGRAAAVPAASAETPSSAAPEIERLPGNPPEDRIVGYLKNRKPVPAGAVEMIWNDYRLWDHRYGAGAWELTTANTIAPNAPQLEILAIARALYGRN